MPGRFRLDVRLLQAAVQKMLTGDATPEEAAAEVTEGIKTYYEPFQD